jgi:hypothetical protein
MSDTMARIQTVTIAECAGYLLTSAGTEAKLMMTAMNSGEEAF